MFPLILAALISLVLEELGPCLPLEDFFKGGSSFLSLVLPVWSSLWFANQVILFTLNLILLWDPIGYVATVFTTKMTKTFKVACVTICLKELFFLFHMNTHSYVFRSHGFTNKVFIRKSVFSLVCMNTHTYLVAFKLWHRRAVVLLCVVYCCCFFFRLCNKMELHHLLSWMCLVIVNAGPADRGRNDITLNTEKLNELGSQGQLLLRHIAITTHSCGIKEQPKFRRKLLRHSPVTCNDGSPAGWVVRVISLEWLFYQWGMKVVKLLPKKPCKQNSSFMKASRLAPTAIKLSGVANPSDSYVSPAVKIPPITTLVLRAPNQHLKVKKRYCCPTTSYLLLLHITGLTWKAYLKFHIRQL